MRRENEKTLQLKCLLEEDKICDNCCACYICDLDPGKICDNCAKCLSFPDYSGIIIDEIVIIEEKPVKKKLKKR